MVDGVGPIQEDPIQEEDPGHVSWIIALVIWLTARSADADVVARSIRELLWKSPSQPPSIVTPSCLYFIRKEANIFETAVETLLV